MLRFVFFSWKLKQKLKLNLNFIEYGQENKRSTIQQEKENGQQRKRMDSKMSLHLDEQLVLFNE
jgi:hypothetical protein